MIIEAMRDFKKGVSELELQSESLNVPALKKQLDSYYSTQFAAEYEKRNDNKSISTNSILNQLDTTGAYLQYLYIQNNSNSLGFKNKLDKANDDSFYSKTHEHYHPQINQFAAAFGYYDVFLVDSETGRVVYSVFKEVDYASSLLDGPFSNSGLGKVFKRANKSHQAEVFLQDFSPYAPSYEVPAFFIATPIFDQGKKIGILIFQMPIAEINNIMTNKQQWSTVGMGSTGEAYIIGSDYKARSLSRLLFEDKTGFITSLTQAGVAPEIVNAINSKNTNIGLQLVDNAAAKAAVSGQKGEKIFSDYRNRSVLSAYAPLKIPGLDWAILTEIDEQEALAPVVSLKQKIINITLIAVVIIGFVAVLIGLLFANVISKPMHKIAEAMKNIAQGDGDLTQRLDESGGDEVAEIAHFFNAFVIKVQDLVREISDYSMQLAAALEEVSVTAVQAHHNVNEQQLQIEKVATAMNEMNATVHDVAKNASQAASEAQKGESETQTGGRVIEETISAINQLNSNISAAAQTVSTLEQDGESIGTVLDVIRGIAEQTNLLALNAAIEAARAGEQGRGFAVVADEVRTLASRTQDSTAEIQSMIEKLQHGTKMSSSAMDASVKLAEDAVNQARGGTDALQNITRAIATIDDMTHQIASASEQQSAVAEEINRNITLISDAAKDTVLASNKSARAGEGMAKLAGDLSTLVHQFKF